jgi:ABC-type dipeptide/oligopeptide/nickel transport system permease component
MTDILIRRLFHSIFVLIGVSIIVFGLVRLSGDATALLLPIDATEEDEAQLRAALGLDGSLPVQYLNFAGRALTGDFGTSIRHRQPAMEMVMDRLPATFQLAAASFAIALAISIPLGILSALYPNSFIDRISVLMALIGQAIPTFLLGILLIILVAVQLRWLPSSGRGGVEHLILPSLTLGTYSAAIINRLLRSSLLEVMNEDYIRTSRAKGFREQYIVLVHALKNAAIPVVTVMGLQIGNLISGSVVTETVFAYPGAGLLLVQSLGNRDFPVVQAFVMVIALVVILINLVVDIIYGLIDPRVRVTG